MSVVKFYRSSG